MSLQEPEDCHKEIDKLYEELMQKRKAFPNAGLRDVVLDATLAGMLGHEAVGHTVEADLTVVPVASKTLAER